MDDGEREALDRFRGGLEGWALDHAKHRTAKGLPRLAFLGLSCWFDQAARYASGKRAGLAAWQWFFDRFQPARAADAEVLYRGLRCTLAHQYGTENVALTHGNPSLHGERRGDNILVLNIETLIEEAQAAFALLMAEAETDADLRARLVRAADEIIAPILLVPSRDLPRRLRPSGWSTCR